MERFPRWAAWCAFFMISLMTIPAFAQDQPRQAAADQKFAYVNDEGSVFLGRAQRPGKMHFIGILDLATADYFRGALRGDREDLDELSLQPSIAVTAEFWNNFTATVGIANGLADPEPFPFADTPKYWYKANPFFGLAARFAEDFVAGLTYTIYTTPNDAAVFAPGDKPFGSNWSELALALRYAGRDGFGWLQPQFKISTVSSSGSGWFMSLGMEPTMGVAYEKRPITFSLPIEWGMGFDDYFSDSWDNYVKAGLAAAIPLGFSPEWGNWDFTAALNFIFREGDVRRAGGPFDDGGDVVVYGMVGVRIVY